MARLVTLVWLLGIGSILGVATAQEPAATQPQTQPSLPFIHVNREAGYIDLDAAVASRDVEWLELLACSPRTLEYESLLTVAAKPSHIHLALLILGLEPGRPQSWQWNEGNFTVRPPQGPRVAIFAVIRGEDGQEQEVPINQWIVNQATGQPLAENIWLFTGSKVENNQGQAVYLADLSGAVITLVNFGDDLLARSTQMTNRNDQQAWNAAADKVPPVGTPIKLRLRPTPDHSPPPPADAPPPADPPATQPDPQEG